MTKRSHRRVDNLSRVPATLDGDVTKADLQRRMDMARESISQTVEEIKEKVEDHYESVRDTVTGILDWRDQFQKDPIIWSAGALCAGFALGYSVGRTQHRRASKGGKPSELATFTDSLVEELGDLARQLPTQAIDPRLKKLFGFGLSELIEEIGNSGPAKRKSKARSKPGAKARKRASREGGSSSDG